MPICSNCSAPLPIDSIECHYCGSRNDVDLKGVHYYTTHASDSDRICPRCKIKLETVDLKIDGKFLIERCEKCFGLFFDPGELEAVLQATVTNVFGINLIQLDKTAKRTSDYEVVYLKCPVCAKPMNRVNFGAKSGVIANRCRDHGVWLDGGDLRHLFEWMKAGGKLFDQQKKEQNKKDEANQMREKLGNLDLDSFGGTLHAEDPDLYEIVMRAAKSLVKK